MQTWVSLPFADGEYLFKLGLGQIAELEKKADAGLGAIFARTLQGRYALDPDAIVPTEAAYRYGELIEVIRQALLGGGVAMSGTASGIVDGKPVTRSVTELLNRHVLSGDDRAPVRDVWALAAAILHALIEGYEPAPKAEPAEPATPTSGSTSTAP